MLREKGQSLIEFCIVLPFVTLCFGGILICSYKQIAFLLADHWTYDANLCLATPATSLSCKQTLIKRLKQIPFSQFKIKTFFRNSSVTKISLTTSEYSFLKINIHEELSLPLTSKDFNRF